MVCVEIHIMRTFLLALGCSTPLHVGRRVHVYAHTYICVCLCIYTYIWMDDKIKRIAKYEGASLDLSLLFQY